MSDTIVYSDNLFRDSDMVVRVQQMVVVKLYTFLIWCTDIHNVELEPFYVHACTMYPSVSKFSITFIV